MKKTNSDYIGKMVICAVFAALAYVCVAVFRIKVSFLTLDIKDAVITTAAMLVSPAAGIMISVVVSLIEMLTVSDTMLYGFIMNVLSTVTFSTVASAIYRARKTLVSAILGLLCAVASVTAVMMLANLFITPFYMGVQISEVVSLIPKLLLPFNLTKSVLNASLIMIIYKPISTALHRAGVLKAAAGHAKGNTYKFGIKNVVVTLGAVAVLVLSLVIFFFVLNAEIIFFR